jgi:ribosomal protein L2
MGKKTILFVTALILVGCSNNNKLTINNLTMGPIHINFRAADHSIDAGTTFEISDIPNGTYVYSTTYGVPAEAKSATIDGNAAGGSLTFEKKDTQVLMLYGSTLFDGTYAVNATMSTTLSSTSPTSQ